MAGLGRGGGARRLASKLAAVFACACVASGAVAADLAVSVTGLKSAAGQVAIAVFSGSDGFPTDDARAAHRARVSIDGAGRAQALFKDLAPGDYAVAVFHDDDNSGKLETNLFGMPKKGYGFSNNARPSLRAPRFDEARFALPDEGAKAVIELMY